MLKLYVCRDEVWINRDPIHENGFRRIGPRLQGTSDVSKPYCYVLNSPINSVDPFGLAVWACTRGAFGGLSNGRHAYLWRDDGGTPSSCGMSGICGFGKTFNSNDKGPSGDSGAGEGGSWYGDKGEECRKVPGSDGKEDDVFKCCQKNANGLPFYCPGVLDCHTPVKTCLLDNGLPDPGHPRLGR